MRLVLASASPRRRALLREAGLDFEVHASSVSEELEGRPSAEEAAQCLAERKARAVAARLEEAGETELFVLGADTVVAVDGPGGERLLGKPADPAEARAMLEALSGSRHRVVTGLAVLRLPGGALWRAFERTWVTMRAITPSEIAAYLASGEWRDKAGGYAIQESADAFVVGLEEGGFDNVVGLPVQRTLELLERARGGDRPPRGEPDGAGA